MSSERTHTPPEFLTVEEAARLLRIGRTKAYALTQEWRASGGRSGLPVVDLGSVLRVPRAAIEQLAQATTLPTSSRAVEAPESRPTHPSPRRMTKAAPPRLQPSLFDTASSET